MKENYSAVNMMILQEKGYFGHDDASLIVDGDPHFIINPISREIVNNSKKTDLIQFDHNSERITFECPHFIEGHDMTFCNKVVIDYSVGESKGVYEVNDLAVKENDSDTVVFTWLISSNVTTTLGKIKFALTFKCVLPDGTVTYKWGTKRNDTLQCLETEQGNAWVAYDYPDILEQWKTKIFDARDNSVKDIVSSTNNGVSKIVSEGKSQVQEINTAGITVKNDIEKKASDTLATIPENYTQLDSDVSVLKSENVRYSARFGNALIKKVTGDKSVIITDSAEAVFHDLKISGKSEQIITTGANLLDLNGFTKSGNATYYAVGSKITVIGSSSNDTITYFFPIENMGGKTYVLSCKTISNSESSADYSIAIGSVLGSTTYLTPMEKGTIQLKKTISESATQVGIFITPNNVRGDAVALNTLTIECLMFIENDTTIPWEPYTGGAPSPSPDYPQDIISTGTVSTGAQLLNADTIVQGMISTETGAESESSVFVRSDYIPVKPGDYILSGDGLKPYFNHVMYFNQEKVIQSSLAIKPTNGKFTVADETAYIRIRFISKDGTSGTVTPSEVAALKPMLNTGDTALPWEPYTGGKPSPSVEYPQTLEVGVTGANLANITSKNNTGISVISENGEIKINGTVAEDHSSADIYVIGVYGSKIVRLAGINTYQIFGLTNDEELYVINVSSVVRGEKGETPITYNGDVTCIIVRLKAGKTYNNMVIRPMVSAGNTALPWEPYRSASAPITLTEPLRGVGGYWDRIMCRDGVWGIERYWKSIMLDGNIPYREHNQLNVSKEVRANEGTIKTKPIKGLFNNFNACDRTWDRDEIGIGAFNSGIEAFGAISLRIPVDAVPVEYMAAHPTEAIYHPYDFPTWEPFPDATQQALNELTTYAGTTHLTITAGGPATGIEAEYVQDINGVIADLLKQIEELRNAHTN